MRVFIEKTFDRDVGWGFIGALVACQICLTHYVYYLPGLALENVWQGYGRRQSLPFGRHVFWAFRQCVSV